MSSQQFSISSGRTAVKLALKRGLDVVASALGLLVLSPLFLVIALAIKRSSPGPVFYNASRVGMHGKPIHVRKFRTMVANAASLGPGVTTQGDPRITPVGRFLRKWKLDELPQLINVLEGTMSLVGPRPEDPRYVALYTPEQRRVLDVRPGITSLASVKYRHEEQMLSGNDWEAVYIHEVMPSKLKIDLEYVEHAGPWQDIRVIFATLVELFR